MKKYLHIIFFTTFVFSALGFRGCGVLGEFIEALFIYHATGQFPLQDASGETEIYSIAVGEDGAIYTRAGRPPAIWAESQSGTTQGLNFVRTYYHPDSLVACVVGNSGTVLISRDKGITWSDHSIPALSENLYGFDFIYTSNEYINIVVCGDAGTVYRSSNSGGIYTWQQITTNTTEKLNTIAVYSDFYIAAGENGKIIKTKDGGLTWQNVGVSDTTADFNRLFLGFLVNAYYHGWIVGDNGKIYMTTDYGDTWLPRESGTSENLYDITFNYALEGIAVGANGVARYTTYLGYAWQEDTYLSGLTTRDIVSISGVDDNTASAITVNNFNGDSQGADTTFFLAVSSEPFTDVEDDENLVLSDYRLEQNYPNPFNPTTTIEYSIPQAGLVSIKIFDILGTEVTSLINEEKQIGNHEIKFDASHFSSGIYLYKLTAGSFIETKKMILLK